MSMNWPLPGQTEKQCVLEISTKKSNLELNDMRAEVDDIDTELVMLLERRFALSRKIGKEKERLGLALKDERREAKILEQISDITKGGKDQEYILNVFKAIFKESILQQHVERENQIEISKVANFFPQICLIGVGLIGGALALRIKNTFPNCKLFAIDLPENLSTLQASSLFEQCGVFGDKHLVSQVSLIVLACPPDLSAKFLHDMAPVLRPGQLVIDLCSVKGKICEVADRLDLNGAEFIGAHPFFGTEKRGFSNAPAVEMEGRSICLVPGSKSSELSLARLKSWFSALNLRVLVADAFCHDRTVALTSHLIQLFASALGSIIQEEILEKGNPDHLLLSGGVLAGLARLMRSQAQMWKQISKQNLFEIQRTKQKLFDRIERMLQFDENDEAVFELVFNKAAQVSDAVSKLS